MGVADQAGAAVKITCTSMSGSASGTTVVSGLHRGEHGRRLATAELRGPRHRRVHPLAEREHHDARCPVLAAATAKKCPGYVKGAVHNPAADKFTAPVTGDTGDGIAVPGSAKGEVCISTSGSISALKPLKIS